MTKTRRTFTDEFKREAVALLESSGRPLVQVAIELGIQPSMLRSWRAVGWGTAPGAQAIAPASASALPRVPSPAELAAEIRQLKRELDRIRQEREVLKKAIAIFSEAPR
jgi:transposase